MKRRKFVLALSGLVPAARIIAQEGPPPVEPIEKMTAGAEPAISICHVGFRPEARKQVVVRRESVSSFEMREVGSGPPFRIERPLVPIESDLGAVSAGDFSDVTREGLYQIQAGAELSPPFFIRPDAWRRFLPTVVSYHRAQRCGVAVPNVHPACHLDDARSRDNGEHVDTTGGWHDAGDLRKWMDATMMNAFGLLAVARNLGTGWDLAGSGLAPLQEELRWGNTYFLKMQDRDGRVWADVGGGLNGDNSDNHWTDNIAGTADDRYLNPAKNGPVQAMFTAMQAMYARQFVTADPRYSGVCLNAAKRCWDASPHEGATGELGWWTLAAVELHRAAPSDGMRHAAEQLASRLAALQQTGKYGGQSAIRGFWRTSEKNPNPYQDAIHSALPAYVLLETARAFSDSPAASGWRDAARLYIESYVRPMCARSAYGLIPYGLFVGSPTPERYRPLTGELTFRFFMPVRKQFWWLGLNAHIGSHALLLATAARDFGEPAYRNLAYRQLEWIFGANPFGASLASGIGVRNPYPHSRYVGIIPGGIMNGICGNMEDEPILDTGFSQNWRTNEYWSPQVGYFEWAQSVLEAT